MKTRLLFIAVMLAACAADDAPVPDYYGTLEPFASEAVYFLITDRFVDGDPGNNFEDQGVGERNTFNRPVQFEGLRPGNIGYLGGDFKGLLDNAGYIAEMGFTAVWLTPIVDNPDEAFLGGEAPTRGAVNVDKGKTGYHGYWGVNFFEVDEHLESPGLRYADLTRQLLDRFGIKTILDVVCNHGSPSYTMPEDQPKFGEIYDADGTLVADHQNLHPSELRYDNPLHAFYRHEPDLAQLSDMNYDNPEVLDYFVAAHSKWIDQGAAAVRIDTIRHMPHSFWKQFAAGLRDGHPGLFLFAEAWSFDTAAIAEHTYPENGGISVLDFPGKAAMSLVFAEGGSYDELRDYLQLDSGIYQNPYELMTFYDNHDMPRIDADDAGFIDANNWLFTSRGIPVVYYGSEMGFRSGTDQHSGNRDYFGPENVEAARRHPIRRALADIANIRKSSLALQRGLQLNLQLEQDFAAFYRVYQRAGDYQTALVLLNKSDAPVARDVSAWLFDATWVDAGSGQLYSATLPVVPAHGAMVLLTDAPFGNSRHAARLARLQQAAARP